ncbi:hypothetical protein P9133_01920 [Bacillus thuringiensis]|uniref:Uncharacterized protein n=1 Tax=Bacillus thuringiensis HD-771 TaxID=1218175 RepID=A0A9W3JLR6_BACTU|nr:hypothetical protein [Bacillus thuringiensis]AFQ19732.1 hypothetical protein BTG_31978 [Bacillus thuringiensis HD-771]MEC3263239.1 hypothetical protein [Bacillus thuringiensis]MEC3515721.1 hypothetical protein [Bacillus thuringiensis]MEC3542488.1 hypothetical protein [Bacillus thuringiensis]MED2073535.1 hypothetical protein [Bacillus thuringiensis]
MDKKDTNIKPTMKSYEVVGVRNVGVIVVPILISIIYNLFSFLHVTTVEGVVVDKLQQDVEGRLEYQIVVKEENGSEQLIRNSNHRLDFNERDNIEAKSLQDGIKKGGKYKFKVRGFGMPDIKEYPNFISYTLTDDELREQAI